MSKTMSENEAKCVLVIANLITPGGMVTWFRDMIPRISSEYSVILATRGKPDSIRDSIENIQSNIKWWDLPLHSLRHVFAAYALSDIIHAFKPNVVIVHDSFAAIPVVFGRLLSGHNFPLILVMHSRLDAYPMRRRLKGKIVNSILRIFLGEGDKIVVVSDFVAQGVEDIITKAVDLSCIPNGIAINKDEPDLSWAVGESLRVGFVGRLTPEKGPDRFVELINLARTLDISWHLIGSGSMESELKAKCKSVGMYHRVCFHGWVDSREVKRKLGKIDVLLVTSRTEGCPYSVLEAFAAGVLVIALPVGGVPALLEGGRCGYLVPDLPGMMVVLSKLIDPSEAEIARKKIRNAYALLQQKYSLDRMSAAYVKIINQSIASCEIISR
ncbi:MAG: hypothetical protein CMN84_09205 [Spongiibacteraceae bacterium]|jgi:glycosyltransferase involved in cell wall biosynthesis|nr:hypothetical protein [Spongiibacteraceae bacterium]